MDSTPNQTKGLEQLEFLTDKAKRIVFQLEAEEKELRALKDEMRQIGKKKRELGEVTHGLKSKLTSLEKDREKVEEKVTNLLKAIGDLGLE